MKRDGYCGQFREEVVGKRISAAGWVQSKRDMGGVIFIDLRDREGTLQVVFNRVNLSEAAFHAAETLKNESVIAAGGLLAVRDEETYNPRLQTGGDLRTRNARKAHCAFWQRGERAYFQFQIRA